MAHNHTLCLICGSDRLRSLNGYEDHQLVKCHVCGFVFMSRIPAVSELTEFYSAYSYEGGLYVSPLTIIAYNKLLDEFEVFRQTGNLLDTGCGEGSFLGEARKRGWNVYGTEYSKKALEICAEKGIEMREGALNASDFEGIEFDVITSFEVLEHLNELHREFEQIHKLLRPGGLYYCTTPNWDSLLRLKLRSDYNVISYPEHLCYFTRNTLAHLAKDHGLKKKRMLSTGFSLTRLRTSQGSKEAVNAPDNSDERLRQNIDKRWYLGLAKNLVNSILTFTGLGSTIKGYFVK